jgi:YD repeat-containing protein
MMADDDRAPRPFATGDMYSTAFQFYSHINADVDPRTGMYSASVDLATGEGNHLRGPHFPFRLSYSAVDTIDDGFGTGWRLGLTELDVRTGLLTLSSGDSHTVDGLFFDEPAIFPDRKLDSCSVVMTDADQETAVVEHITGVVEYLQATPDRPDLLRPVRIVNPSGDAINLEWTAFNGISRLTGVVDGDGEELLRIDYSGPGIVKVLIHLADARHRKDSLPLEMYFDATFGQLDSITIPLVSDLNSEGTAVGDEATWKFRYYNHAGAMMLLTAVTSPDGLRDEVEYNLNAHELPDGAPMSHMPAVSRRTRVMEANTTTVFRESLYDFGTGESVPNFYGFPRVQTWENRSDQLLHMSSADDFTYRSTEQQIQDGQLLCTIERVYNHWHLITSETTTRGSVVQTVVTGYGDKTNTSFEDQYPSFQLPHKVTTTAEHADTPGIKQVTVVESTYDDYGNVLTRHESTTDTTEDSVYYKPEGETGEDGTVLCPPDPIGKVRRLKSRITKPGKNGGPVRSTHYRYTEVPVRNPVKDTAGAIENAVGNILERLVARFMAKAIAKAIAKIVAKSMTRERRKGVARRWPRERTYYIQASDEITTVGEGTGEKTLVHSKQTFITDLGDQHGSVKQETREQDGLTETRTFTYSTDDTAGTVTTTTEHTAHVTDPSHDPIVNTTSETLYLISGLVRSAVDALGNLAEFTYDSLGRRTSEVLSPRVDGYAVTTSWRYQLTMSERWIERIGITGLSHRVWMDEQGRTILRQEPLPDNTLIDVHELEYDGYGQLTREVQSDRLRGTEALRQVTLYDYDDWGRCSLIVSADESRTISETVLIADPATYGDEVITRTTQWQEHGSNGEKTGWRSTDLDTADRQRRTAAGTWTPDGGRETLSATSWQYDGVGRCIRMEDPVGNVTLQAWDAYDRLVRTDLPDGTVVLRTYADGHEDDFIASLAVMPPASETEFWGGALNAGELLLGTRTWDGLGRLQTEQAGSLTTSYAYKAHQLSADRKILPNKDWLQLAYDVRLREVLTGSTLVSNSGGVETNLTGATYDRRLGLPETITAEGVGTMTIRTDYLGRMTQQTIALDGDDTRSCEVVVTPGGLVLEKTGTDGVKQTYGYDDNGRLESMSDQDVEVTLEYDELSRLSSRTAVSKGDGRTVTQGTTYDELGRVSGQTWLQADASTPAGTKSRMALGWWPNDKVHVRTWYGEDGTPALRTETMEYDARGRLVSHAIDAVDGEHPTDEMGNPYVKQTFVHDCLDNLRTVTTTLLDGRLNETTYTYDIDGTPPNLDRLVGVSNSLKGYPGFDAPLTLGYDDNGNLVDDGQGRKLEWDGAGRLSTVTLADGTTTISYAHGPDGRVSRVSRGQTTTFRYREDGAIAYEHESSANEGRRYIRTEGGIVAETHLAGAIRETYLLGTDPQGSVVTESDPGATS